ncbi:cytochrome P450 [Rugosimonospora africana]|uniref:Cytochrome P450 n=1 Tax=Rugosimonospora africana TaxID=556532 RepID=A0A8J3QUD8_9ACTN|nr:cytochrome P450 [Rugosimonospora africana]GIH16262.1 cytochrome P450 [Rugosimonospora africana]
MTVPRAPGGRLNALREMRRDPLGFLTQVRRDCGMIAQLPTPGPRHYLVSDPAEIQRALTATGREFAKGQSRSKDPDQPGFQPLQRILGQGLLTSAGPLWRRQRRLIQPMFHHARIAEYCDVFARLAARTGAGWRDGEVREVHTDMTELTLAIVARTVFDIDLDAAIVAQIRQWLGENMATARRGADLPWMRFLDLLPLPSTRRWNADRRKLDGMVHDLIADRRAAGGSGSDLLSLLLAARDAETGEAMPDSQVRDEAVTLLLAGHETTANALAWSLHLLGTHPDAQARLRAELDEVLGADREPGGQTTGGHAAGGHAAGGHAAGGETTGGETTGGGRPGAADLPRLRYALAVVREAMRLYPPAWVVARRMLASREVCGRRLPAGSMLVFSSWVVHRDPTWWPEPESFRPERWLETSDRPRYAYFPFGGGPRQCIGNGFAESEAVMALATLCRSWSFAPASTDPIPPRPLITLRPGSAVPMLVRSIGP